MSGNQRTLIRKAIALRLSQWAPLYRVNIYIAKKWTESDTALPFVMIQATGETVESYDKLPTNNLTFLTRTLELSLLCAVKAIDDSEDQLDLLTQHIEEALESFEIPSLESADVRLQNTKLETDTSGSQPISIAELVYHVSYNRPYRITAEPYVQWGQPFVQSGYYPGGRIVENSEPPEHEGLEYPSPATVVYEIDDDANVTN